ncbi:hypothetical protein FHU36_001711 [Nonomuraea muscovyensis]|uniref:Uncharacterized protein n=1 Tax=Nonomuraea muscovyensis TaxID=1124761 RepID=A0A7X0BYP7_9ACTN|nr:hypothetical protein [Nonomuraea muscovyensis]
MILATFPMPNPGMGRPVLAGAPEPTRLAAVAGDLLRFQ